MESFVAPQQADDPGSSVSRPPHGLSIAVVALLAVQGTLCFLLLLSWPAAERIASGSSESIGLLDALRGLAIAAAWLLQAGLFIATAVCFLYWLHGSYLALGSRSLTFSPRSAVTGWLIPFVNLVHGWKSVHTLYRDSRDEEPTPGSRAPIVGAWWSAYLVCGLFGRIGNRMSDRDLAASIKWLMMAEGLKLVAAVLLIVIVRRIDRWQSRVGR